jgi:ubiquinone/menaquinone biosynthesis C-methylase UbiE
MKYPPHKIYEQLYLRYFKRTPAQLLQGVDLRGKKVVDLCGGNGRLSLYAKEHGASQISYVDEHDMVSDEYRKKLTSVSATIIYIAMVHVFFRSPWHKNRAPYDVIACQQGVNYWMDQEVLESMLVHMAPGGKFVFNTFNTRPSEKPTVKEYELEGYKFAEVSYLIGDTVHHVQTREGMSPHVTEFSWLSSAQIQTMLLAAGFTWAEVTNDGPTAIWHAVK